MSLVESRDVENLLFIHSEHGCISGASLFNGSHFLIYMNKVDDY